MKPVKISSHGDNIPHIHLKNKDINIKLISGLAPVIELILNNILLLIKIFEIMVQLPLETLNLFILFSPKSSILFFSHSQRVGFLYLSY